MPHTADLRAALLSLLLPGLGQFRQGRPFQAFVACFTALLPLAVAIWLGQIAGRAVEVVGFMVLALPGWIFQGYDAYLGASSGTPDWLRTWRIVWQRGHDIRFLGLLLGVSALTDTWIILNNLDYLLPFYCTKPDGILGFVTKAVSPALHLAVGYGFIRLRRWALLLYLIYATYGFTNGIVNLSCFGPGRIRSTLLIVIILSTLYILRRRRVLLQQPTPTAAVRL
ncbi:MAG: hypothetical protein ACT4O4_04000 [Nitrospiraceae bacterium]